jgi:hypothetical protein
MATDHQGPRKMGVYEGAGTARSQSKSFLPLLAVLVVVILLAYWLL